MSVVCSHPHSTSRYFFRVCVENRAGDCQHGLTGDPVQGSYCRPGIACRESDAECWVVCGMDFCGFRFLVLLCGMGLWALKQERMHRGR